MKIRLFDNSGKELNATINRETIGVWDEYIFESRSGRIGSGKERNPEYQQAMALLLRQLRQNQMVIQDILVMSNWLKDFSLADKRVNLPNHPFPINLAEAGNLQSLHKEISDTVRKTGRLPGAGGPGNAEKRLSIRVSRLDSVIREDMPDEILDDADEENEGELHSRFGGYSGPPPSTARGASERKPSEGYVYILELIGGHVAAIKIGFTSNVDVRIHQLNLEIHPAITGCHWHLLESIRFATEREAYEYEQELNRNLRSFLIKGEREIFSIQALEKIEEQLGKRLIRGE